MTEVSRILSAIDQDDPRAAEQLLPFVYDQLRAMAARKLADERSGQTLQATDLVHEAYLRLVGDHDPGWSGRGHFFAAAAEAMRRILINRARDRGRLKRGGGRSRVELGDLRDPFRVPDEDLLDLDDALDRLAAGYPRAAELVKLRFFGGLSLDEAASTLGIATRTADREWSFARAWLRDSLSTA